MRLNTEKNKHADDNLYQGIAIELMLGCSLPDDLKAWPIGLAGTWNEFADSKPPLGETIGDLARGFLSYRLSRLIREAAA